MKKIVLKINAWLHLWLGLASGIIVVILAITGCALVFEEEIKYSWLYSASPTNDSESELLPPSVIYNRVKAALPQKDIASFWYYGHGKPIKISVSHGDTLLFVNPYNGHIIAEVDHEDFFHLMDAGHRHLWLPPKIGRSIAGWATLLFFIVTLSGLILWWPKRWNKRMIKQSFTINWKTKWKRINYDLHNVLGFYSLLLAVIMAFTAMMMSFPWLRKSVIELAGGYPRAAKQTTASVSEENRVKKDALQAVDAIWYQVRTTIAIQNKDAVIVHIPEEEDDLIYACTDMYRGSWRDLRFDRYTLALLPSSQKPINKTNSGEWISRSNFGLHTGYIGGLTTKILYFFASLICATLPITGFYVWWYKKKKKTKGKRKILKPALV
ncbi:PepSY-associated TM helix domain-containing protein [Sphingobacterium oryzagri]|uniref:PepSY-associated TM helix domain-containing protein n=1 Tax=Sphingobacterium oryzagri TaxID=3025669 RepID=A0ABY7WJG4_9SPHI|nr:PepSY-associated TM helix domain-containing protein [Sphingobacterium sp. KACC 22765]WDF69738.1 PepSY-associated TM helix domain-containing protein [Sphingobacterium sp. KACC 22765]